LSSEVDGYFQNEKQQRDEQYQFFYNMINDKVLTIEQSLNNTIDQRRIDMTQVEELKGI